MRLDSRLGHNGWQCFDVERCARINGVIFVDDALATWGEYDRSLLGRLHRLLRGYSPLIVHHEKRIRILVESRMVLFNPLPDEDVRDTEELPVVRDVVERKRLVLRNLIDPKQGQRA